MNERSIETAIIGILVLITVVVGPKIFKKMHMDNENRRDILRRSLRKQ